MPSLDVNVAPDVQILPWDTGFFGYTIGRIDMPAYDESELEALLEKARQQEVRLLYVFTDRDAILSQELVRKYNVCPVDTKLTYRYKLRQSEPEIISEAVTPFSTEENIAQLYELAYQSGEYSRFKVDPAFGEENFKRLYQQWIDKSLSGQAADATFVYMMDEDVRGFVTVRKSQPVATIGLIATHISKRGGGIGSALMNHVKRDLRFSGTVSLDVVTQKKNLAACRFYERNGFTLSSEVNVYHIWL